MSNENNKYTQEEKDRVLNFWNSRKSNPPSLSETVEFFTDKEESDPRSIIGRKVRQILVDAQIKPKTAQWEKVEEVVLTDDQKTFILNNIKDNRVIDLARELFSDRKVAPLGREVRTINKFLDSVGERVVRKGEETPVDGKYEPPTTFHDILRRVNDYLHINLSTQSITAYQKKCLETTINFLHSPRFLQEINNYDSIEKRVSFESEFIRSVFDKPDLAPEEVSLIINWCSDIIQAADIKKLLDNLHNSLENITNDDNGKYSQSLAETIGKVTTNLNEVLKRQERIYGLLNTARGKRTEDKQNKNASLSQLYEFFREEENRKKMLKQTEILRQNREQEIKRLESLNDVIFLSLGLGKDEVIF